MEYIKGVPIQITSINDFETLYKHSSKIIRYLTECQAKLQSVQNSLLKIQIFIADHASVLYLHPQKQIQRYQIEEKLDRHLRFILKYKTLINETITIVQKYVPSFKWYTNTPKNQQPNWNEEPMFMIDEIIHHFQPLFEQAFIQHQAEKNWQRSLKDWQLYPIIKKPLKATKKPTKQPRPATPTPKPNKYQKLS